MTKASSIIRSLPVKLALGLAIAAFLTTALWREGQVLGDQQLSLHCGTLSAATLLAIVYRLANACIWSLALSALGYPVSVARSAALWLKTESARWLPGSLWNFGSRAVTVERLGVPSTIGALSVFVELLLVIAAWSVIAGSGAIYYQNFLIANFARHLTWEWPLLLVASLAGVFLAVLYSCRLRRSCNTGIAKLKERITGLKNCQFQWSTLVKAGFSYVALNVLNGVCFWLIVVSIQPANPVPVEAAIAANAAAWLVGFFAILAPGGLVVREACLASLLSVWLSPPIAITAAVLWRVVQIASEITALLAVLIAELVHRSGQLVSSTR